MKQAAISFGFIICIGYALIKLFRVFSYSPSLKNGHFDSDFK